MAGQIDTYPTCSQTKYISAYWQLQPFSLTGGSGQIITLGDAVYKMTVGADGSLFLNAERSGFAGSALAFTSDQVIFVTGVESINLVNSSTTCSSDTQISEYVPRYNLSAFNSGN